jgi:hypothetical protein
MPATFGKNGTKRDKEPAEKRLVHREREAIGAGRPAAITTE